MTGNEIKSWWIVMRFFFGPFLETKKRKREEPGI